jgi:hypothetical protein
VNLDRFVVSYCMNLMDQFLVNYWVNMMLLLVNRFRLLHYIPKSSKLPGLAAIMVDPQVAFTAPYRILVAKCCYFHRMHVGGARVGEWTREEAAVPELESGHGRRRHEEAQRKGYTALSQSLSCDGDSLDRL